MLSILLISLTLITFSPTKSAADYFAPEVENLRQEILTLDRTRQNAIQEQKQDQLTEQQHQATGQYINYLSARITSLCSGLISSPVGTEAVADLPCPQSDTLLPGYQTPASQTSTEQVDNLNRTLMESLGKFDDMLLDEQQKIAAQKNAPSGSYGADGDGEGDTSGSSNSDSQGDGQAQDNSALSHGNQQNQQNTASSQEGAEKGKTASSGAGGGKKSSNTPPIADDDDIVARQLREAAESETDPELKKKLWDEYKKYKREVN